jgi:predicted O-linked N-acetylglucosamine transferase (SPINDLY family)
MTHITTEQAIQIALGHHRAGRLAEAETVYRQILAQVPSHGETLQLLGVLAAQRGRLEEAVALIDRAIALDPAVAEYHNSLGECYRRWGRQPAALACFRRATELQPTLALAHGNLASALHAAGRRAEAVVVYHQAILLEPDNFQVHSNLGVALQELDRTDEAISAYRRALELKPDYVVAQRNLGVALHRAGRSREAIAACRRAIVLGGEDAMAYSNLGMALQEAGERAAAIAALERAIVLDPGYVESYNHLGNALKKEGRLYEAIAAYRRALALVPDYPYAYNNLAGVYKEQGRLDLALDCLHKAVELKPDFSEAASNRVFDLHFHPDHDARSILAEHRQWALRYAAPLADQIRPHARGPAPDPHRRLRVGFVSPDFHAHPVGQLLLPLFTHHDRGHAEFVAYSGVREPDALTNKLKAQADRWHTTNAQSDQDLADRIRADRVDILVDLSLHTANNRMLVFARKPAPVQVTMLGLPSTTGLATMDYRLTDPYLDPPGTHDDAYVERSIRLPHCFWCYQPADETPAGVELPVRKNGFVTFGCLNQFPKVTRQALELWVKILQSLRGARLVLHAPAGSHRDAVKGLFQEGGVDPERIEFVAKVALGDYMKRYHELDLCLDPFPFCGGTTTMDALWMGVPVITLAGRTAVGRGGVSILSNLGLTELIAHTPEQYVAIALDWASDHSRLAALHASLRRRMQTSPLMNGRQYAADVEAALREMWKTWCAR